MNKVVAALGRLRSKLHSKEIDMRMVVQMTIPHKKFNKYVSKGTAGQKVAEVLEAIQPEAVYFTATPDGTRGGIMIVDIDEASQLPAIAEPLFMTFDATVTVTPCMSPDDLAAAGLEELGERWG